MQNQHIFEIGLFKMLQNNKFDQIHRIGLSVSSASAGARASNAMHKPALENSSVPEPALENSSVPEPALRAPSSFARSLARWDSTRRSRFGSRSRVALALIVGRVLDGLDEGLGSGSADLVAAASGAGAGDGSVEELEQGAGKGGGGGAGRARKAKGDHGV